jgi:hypothetical protein
MTPNDDKEAKKHERQDVFVIHIDSKEYKVTENALTGSQIRAISKPPIGSDRDLILEVPGPGDDRKIKDSESVTMKNGLQFYSAPKDINPGV